jgi:hypothetical protein
MRVSSEVFIAASPERVWPRLCDADLPLVAPCCFRAGIPTPESCHLPEGNGGIGARRQCKSTHGVVHQRITEWQPSSRLSFFAESDTIGLSGLVSALQDTFTLTPSSGGTLLRRVTTFHTTGILAMPRAVAVYFALRQIHRFVNRNFKALAEAA